MNRIDTNIKAQTKAGIKIQQIKKRLKLWKDIRKLHGNRLNEVIRSGKVTLFFPKDGTEDNGTWYPYQVQYGHTDFPGTIQTILNRDTMLTICSPNTDVNTIQQIIQDEIICLTEKKKQS